MERKLLVLLLLLLVSVAVLPTVPVHATEVHHFTVNPAYVPVRIVITFLYTTNFTGVAVSTTNQSGWRSDTTTTPPFTSGITFSTGDVDVFNVGFSVYYPFAQPQIVNVQVFQGSIQVEGGGQVSVVGDSFSLTFTVVTSHEPVFPTPEQLWDYGNIKIDAGLQSLAQTQSIAIADLENQIHMMWILIFGGLAIALAAYLIPKARRSPVEESS